MEPEHWQELIRERNEWIAHNFPGPDMPNTVLGVIEEMGELVHSHLKRDQGIRGTEEEHTDRIKDAIGDLTVYLLGAMSHYGYVPVINDVPYPVASPETILLELSHRVGSLAVADMARIQITYIVNLLCQYCKLYAWDYDEIVRDTWAGVSQRDWQKYPDTGMPPHNELTPTDQENGQ